MYREGKMQVRQFQNFWKVAWACLPSRMILNVIWSIGSLQHRERNWLNLDLVYAWHICQYILSAEYVCVHCVTGLHADFRRRPKIIYTGWPRCLQHCQWWTNSWRQKKSTCVPSNVASSWAISSFDCALVSLLYFFWSSVMVCTNICSVISLTSRFTRSCLMMGNLVQWWRPVYQQQSTVIANYECNTDALDSTSIAKSGADGCQSKAVLLNGFYSEV